MTNVLQIHVKSFMNIGYEVSTELMGLTVLGVDTLLAVIDCSAENIPDLEAFMLADVEYLFGVRLIEISDGGDFKVVSICRSMDVDTIVQMDWPEEVIRGGRPKQILVVFFGGDDQVLPHFNRLKELIKSGSFEKDPGK